MKTFGKLATAAILAAGYFSVSPIANAVPVGPCDSPFTIEEFATFGSCDSGDKRYTYLDHDFSGSGYTATNIQVSFFTLGDKEIHNFSVDPISVALAGTYSLSYTIEILDPLKIFLALSIDSDVPAAGSGVTFTKEIRDAAGALIVTLTSLNGNPSIIADISSYDLTKLWVYETVVVGADGAINSYTDTYTQGPKKVPEPGSLALLGLGLAGFGLSRRRK